MSKKSNKNSGEKVTAENFEQPTVTVTETQEVRPLTQDEVIERLRGTHIHFLIPCYGGNISEGTFASFVRFTMLAMRYGIPFSLDTMVNESLIPRGRNNLIAKAFERFF